MPSPIKVELLPHNANWAPQVIKESQALAGVAGPCIITVHHIGSTSIPGIRAKPILDLMPVVVSLAALDHRRSEMEALGYVWHGEYGLPGRRFCTKSAPETGVRLVHLHCYERGHPDVSRGLAFRDYLRTHTDIAAAYEVEKVRCQRLHPDNSHAYSDCKSDWIKRTETDALRWYSARE